MKLYSQRVSGSVDVKLRERDLKGVAWIRKNESEIRPFLSYLTHYKAWHLQLPDICWVAFIMNLTGGKRQLCHPSVPCAH